MVFMLFLFTLLGVVVLLLSLPLPFVPSRAFRPELISWVVVLMSPFSGSLSVILDQIWLVGPRVHLGSRSPKGTPEQIL